MASINDFNALFTGKVKAVSVPHVSLDGFKFRLLEFDAYHKWIQTGELKPDGSPKYAQDPELVFDDSGEKVRCTLGLQLVDGSGLATSPSAPFIDNKHYFSLDEVKAMQEHVGEFIELGGARLELKDTAATNSKGFSRVETKIQFDFDSVKF